MQQSNLTFYHLGIAPKMLQILERMKFVSPTPIQHKAIPLALEGKDIMGIAQTGTGKTLAFGIPLVQQLASTTNNARALVVVPTRELALQVDSVLKGILHPFKLSSVVLIGGAPMGAQIRGLKTARVIVATPGRLNDHLTQKITHLRDVEIVVLDEADRMFDMGFAPQVELILTAAANRKQTMLFSATMPGSIVSLATKYLKLPIQIEIAPQGTASVDVTQELFIVKEDVKAKLIAKLLPKYPGPVLVFTRTKAKAQRVNTMLRQLGEKSAEIHSDRSMGQRTQAMEGFKTGRYRVLVATDIAARGIDVRMIELVINYDLPDDLENYVHRIGRTGRAGAAGHAITFATPDQGVDITRIERMIRKTLTRGEHPEIQTQQFATAQTRSFSSSKFRRAGSYSSRRPSRPSGKSSGSRRR